jgi:hypothetical protein
MKIFDLSKDKYPYPLYETGLICIISKKKNIRYYKNGLLHRDEDLPAIEYANGEKHYYKNGFLHRDFNLPAIERMVGLNEYYQNGIRYIEENYF